ncbi:unnamed protein product [Paramecium sonneborni]|uniref:Transcription elongation factor 1 homolog n=1 Tax=Paramecium sonneborni TaxID=65129 RepID=A0A8S1K5F3_9CILI|nr:unnamed protein product [Paramecium sonneborni]
MGGRRKSNKIQKREKMQTIRTIFDCALCGYKNCVIVKIKKIIKMAELNCDKCQVQFKTKIKGLDEAIDVFHKWIAELKKQKLTKDTNEQRFEDNSSNDEDSRKDVEGILKEHEEKDNKAQYSSDSLNEINSKKEKGQDNNQQRKKLRQKSDDEENDNDNNKNNNNNNNEEEDEDEDDDDDDDDNDDLSDVSKIEQNISDFDSLISNADDDEEIIKKIKKC